MQKSVNPIVAILAIAFFAGLLFLYIWAGQQWLKLDRFGLAKAVGAETFVIQYGNKLLWIDKNFSIERELPLDSFNQQSFTGDIDFFANGDLLLALGQKPHTVEQEMAILNRSTNRQINGSGKLYRCNTETLQCANFGNSLPAMDRTFRLYIDESDQVVLADTSRHQLWLLDQGGQVIANKDGFRFPNQIVTQGQHLVLADTNHHALKILKKSANEFGTEVESIGVGLDSPSDWFNKRKQKYSWPVNVAWVKNNYWVLIGDNNLSHSRLALYDLAGKFRQELPLPQGSDPISMLVVNNKVLVVDMALYQLHQFSAAGEFLGSVTIADNKNTFVLAAKEARKWENLQSNSIIVFVLCLVFGFIVAIADHLRSSRRDNKVTAQSRKKHALNKIGENGIWLDVNPVLRRSAKVMPFLLILIAVCVLALGMVLPQNIGKLAPQFIMMFIAIIFMIPYIQASRWRLGIYQDRVELIDHRQRRYSQAYESLLWNDRAFKVDQVVVPFLKQANRGFFPNQETTEFMLPLFLASNKISTVAMLKHQWHSPERMMKAYVLLIFCSIFFVVASQI